MPTLFVATAGGHLTQLTDIARRVPSDGDDVAVWVSNENAQSRSLLEGKNAVFVPEVGRLDVRGAMRSVPCAWQLHREWGFSRVVSTGSALALGYLPYLSARGVRADYIESATRLTRPSVTGRLLRAVPGIRLYTQYEHWAHGPWHYAGCVFDRFVASGEAEGAPVKRVVVVLGTMTDFPFRRMLDALAPLLRARRSPGASAGIPRRDVVANRLHADRRPRYRCAACGFLRPSSTRRSPQPTSSSVMPAPDPRSRP